jgi:NADPH:quinone reductase-like Zn-dependent oxidoreductase
MTEEEDARMRAFALDEFGTPGSVHDRPVPEPGPGQVLVRVEAAGVNPMDVFVVAGYMKDRMEHRMPLIPGLDFAGTVESVGEGVDGFKAGDHVFGGLGKMFFGEGTIAEYATASQGSIAQRPASMDAATGAALPLAGLSALQSMDAIQPRAGENIVVIGAAGGIGSFAVQLLKAAGARAIGVSRGINRDHVLSLGAAEFVDYQAGDPVQAIGEQHPQGVDAIVATVGDKELVGSYAALLHEGGRIASMRGAVDVDALSQRGIRGINIGTRTTTDELARLADLFERGSIKAPRIERFPLASAGDAITEVGGGHARGKMIVLVQ